MLLSRESRLIVCGVRAPNSCLTDSSERTAPELWVVSSQDLRWAGHDRADSVTDVGQLPLTCVINQMLFTGLLWDLVFPVLSYKT